jgi:hypothetical protein
MALVVKSNGLRDLARWNAKLEHFTGSFQSEVT